MAVPTIYGMTGQGPIASLDGGTTWQWLSAHPIGELYLTVARRGDPSGGTWLGTTVNLTLFSGAGLYRSLHALQAAPTLVHRFTGASLIRRIVPSQAAAGRLDVVIEYPNPAPAELWRSWDSGATWALIHTFPTGLVRDFDSPADGEYYWVRDAIPPASGKWEGTSNDFGSVGLLSSRAWQPPSAFSNYETDQHTWPRSLRGATAFGQAYRTVANRGELAAAGSYTEDYEYPAYQVSFGSWSPVSSVDGAETDILTGSFLSPNGSNVIVAITAMNDLSDPGSNSCATFRMYVDGVVVDEKFRCESNLSFSIQGGGDAGSSYRATVQGASTPSQVQVSGTRTETAHNYNPRANWPVRTATTEPHLPTTGGANADIYAIEVSDAGLLAGNQAGEILLSSPVGSNFVVQAIPGTGPVRDILEDAGAARTWAAIDDVLALSIDGGLTWAPSGLDPDLIPLPSLLGYSRDTPVTLGGVQYVLG